MTITNPAYIQSPCSIGDMDLSFTHWKSNGLRPWLGQYGFKTGTAPKALYMSVKDHENDYTNGLIDIHQLLTRLTEEARYYDGQDECLITVSCIKDIDEPVLEPAPVKAEPVKAEPVKAEPVKAEPVKADPKAVPEALSKYGSLGEDLYSATLAAIQNGIDEQKVQDLIDQALNGQTPRKVEFKMPSVDPVVIKTPHAKLETVLKILSQRRHDGSKMNCYLWGPAGSGKSTLCRQAAKVLDIRCFIKGATFEPTEMTGFKSIDGTFIETMFIEFFIHGGVFVWDEYERSDSQVIQVVNDALANGVLHLMDGREIKAHKDFYMIATGNTNMCGSTGIHIAEAQDGAVKDRFWFIHVDYDETLEKQLGPDKAWTSHVQRIRKAARKLHIEIMCTPRASIDGGLLADDMDWDELEEMLIFKGLPSEQVAKIKANV